MTLRSARIGLLLVSLLLIGGLVALQCPDSLCRSCPSDEVVAKQGTAPPHVAAPAVTSLFDVPAAAAARAPVALPVQLVPPERVALCSRLII